MQVQSTLLVKQNQVAMGISRVIQKPAPENKPAPIEKAPLKRKTTRRGLVLERYFAEQLQKLFAFRSRLKPWAIKTDKNW